MDDLLRYVAIVALILLALWLVFQIFYYFVSVIAPKHEIVFVTDAQADEQTKKAPQILSAKLRRLQSYAKQPPTGYGFLQLPALGAIPQEAQQQLETLGDLKNITIKIKDVDVNAIIKAVTEVLSPPRYEMRVHTIDLPDAIEVSCDLFYGDKQVANWRSRARKEKKKKTGEAADNATATAGDTATADNVADANTAETSPDTDRLLDNVLFQIIYDFMTKDEFKGWGISMTQSDYEPQNWQTLQAYTRGVQALTAYQQNLDNKDLDEALSFLEQLPIVAPNNVYGLYYYGLALSENRQEDEAVAVFEQLQRLLTDNPVSPLSLTAADASSPVSPPSSPLSPPSSPRPHLKAGLEKMYYEAKFNEAAARLKFYSVKPGEQAAQTLTELISELEEQKAKPHTGDDDPWYYSKLLAITYAQLAYTHGTLLSLLHDQNPPNMTKIPDEIEDHRRIIEENLHKAEHEFRDELEDCWKQKKGTREEQKQLEREKGDIEFRIKNAAGYSIFRWAEYTADLGDMSTFRKLCNEAISNLEQANIARANHYEVLQNMAMIYEDKRYDPEGIYLDKAESLYLLTTKFVPNDYYQYEHLAEIQWRRLELMSPADDPDLIRKGKDFASKALGLRSHATRALHNMARFNVETWDTTKDKTTAAAKSAAADAIGYFKRLLAIRPNNRTFLSAYIEFLLRAADPKTPDEKIALETGSGLLELAKREGIEAQQKERLLDQAIKMLARAIELTKDENATEDKKQINAKAKTLQDEANALLKPTSPPGGGSPPSGAGSPPSGGGSPP